MKPAYHSQSERQEGGGTPPLQEPCAEPVGAGSPRPLRLPATRTAFAWLLLTSILLATLAPGRAQAPAPLTVQTAGPPDVLLLVIQQPTGGDRLSLNYGRIIPHAQVTKDLAALARETGWALGPPTITDSNPPVKLNPRLGIGRTTGAEFTTAQAVQPQTHSFPINAIASAFRGYRRIAVAFLVAPGFTFQGPREYADKNIKVTILETSSTSYTCQIEILNPNFTSLDLPLSQPAPGTARRSPVTALLLVLAAAAGTGLIVYLMTARLSRRPMPVEAPRPEKEAKTPVEKRR